MRAQAAPRLRGRRIAADPFPAEPPGAERERGHRVRLFVDPRRDLEGAAADVDDQQPPRGPAEPAAGGEEGGAGPLPARPHAVLLPRPLPDPRPPPLPPSRLPRPPGPATRDLLHP